MKTVALVLLAVLAGCEQQHTALGDFASSSDPSTGSTAGIQAPPPSGDLEARVRRLEEYNAKNSEAIAFLNKAYAEQKQQAEAEEANEPAPDAVFAVDVASDVKAGQVDGPATAPVTIVKAFDFACPYCQRVAPTLDELVKDYNGKVRVVYKNFVVHPQVATPVHWASCAAAKQGKYMVFKNAFWDKGFGPYAASQGKDTSTYTEDGILKIAKDAGLDADKMKTDMNSDDCKNAVKADMAELNKWNVRATPSFFINGQPVTGALDKEAFKKLIDERLKAVEASGVAGADYYQKEVMGKGEKQFRSKKQPKPS